eukprot:CAMPEP_0174302060 /NCGR_PEP_ID=MMETSP0809-20121228/59418_1 /TAXON_ID=73025 ORGANISM="Eutreptiella gymnastica-like, Strain CCMP1594" /NCGR_SAMPLE_ID=MMETSP0809 /ASSEMBLY_ACC=CAM_ASM_000658 /LENGTH=93 /DNA_ID=CAMNT_0015407925 /DNA_START=2943 /DNA_END=3221 /DNA_ORIENTATION=-
MAVADAAGPGLALRQGVAEALAVAIAADVGVLLERRPRRDRVLPLDDVAAVRVFGGLDVPRVHLREISGGFCGVGGPRVEIARHAHVRHAVVV